MTDLARLLARLDLDQKITQIQGVVPMDLVDFAKLMSGNATPDLSKGFPYEIDRLPLVRPTASDTSPSAGSSTTISSSCAPT